MALEASTPPPASWLVTHPRHVWPKESAHFVPWLAANLDALARCLELEHLELIGREVPVGERRTSCDDYSQVCALRMDLVARDERGRLVVIEAQIGPADHAHMGQLITYGRAVGAGLVVWVVAEIDPVGADNSSARVTCHVDRRGDHPSMAGLNMFGWISWHLRTIQNHQRHSSPEGCVNCEDELSAPTASSRMSAPYSD